MKRNTYKAILVVGILVALLAVILGWGFERKGVVYSEPLPCFTSGMKVVCFDGDPAGNLVCEQADPFTVICVNTDQ